MTNQDGTLTRTSDDGTVYDVKYDKSGRIGYTRQQPQANPSESAPEAQPKKQYKIADDGTKYEVTYGPDGKPIFTNTGEKVQKQQAPQTQNENKIQLSESDIKLMCEMVVKKLADKLKSK